MGYTYSQRRGDYDPDYYNSIYDPNPANVTIQHPLMRAFDLSSRDASTIMARLNYSPVDILEVGTTATLEMAEHPGVAVGRRNSRLESISASAHLELWPGLVFFSEYLYDRREIEGSFTWTYDGSLSYPRDMNPAFPDFTQPIRETIEDTDTVFAAGFNMDIDQWLSFTGRYGRYDSAETSISLPEVSSLMNTYELTLSLKPYRKKYEVSMNTGYYIEQYKRKDYALDNFPDIGTDSFLGIRTPDYTLHIISVSLSLYF